MDTESENVLIQNSAMTLSGGGGDGWVGGCGGHFEVIESKVQTFL